MRARRVALPSPRGGLDQRPIRASATFGGSDSAIMTSAGKHRASAAQAAATLVPRALRFADALVSLGDRGGGLCRRQ